MSLKPGEISAPYEYELRGEHLKKITPEMRARAKKDALEYVKRKGIRPQTPEESRAALEEYKRRRREQGLPI